MAYLTLSYLDNSYSINFFPIQINFKHSKRTFLYLVTDCLIYSQSITKIKIKYVCNTFIIIVAELRLKCNTNLVHTLPPFTDLKHGSY